MKKFILLIVLAVVLMLSACQNAAKPQTTYNGLNAIYKDPNRTSCDSMEEYEAFLPKTDSIRNFVSYDQISVLGSFRNFHHMPAGGVYPENYSYYVTDINGYVLKLEVTINPGNDLIERIWTECIKLSSLPNEMNNMLHLVGVPDDNYVYSKHGLNYRYLANGSLDSILWKEDNIRYVLGSSGVLAYEFSMDGEETIVQRLLSIDENVSKAAFEELKAHMKANRPPRPVWPCFVGAGVLFAAVLLIALCSYRRIKRAVI